MMSMQPVISVIMATYNTPDPWLKESIDSILCQTFSDFEFIIVDDCSSSDLSAMRRTYPDKRIIWIRNEENVGLTKSLNKALSIAKGKYIARMDADDISLPDRFQIQVDYMNSHPEVIVCGSWRKAIGIENKDEIWNLPKSREEQQAVLFFYNCGLTHPTAMFRKELLDTYGIKYNEKYLKAQDYGMWVQCTRYAPMAMIKKILLLYRKSESQITSNKSNVKIYDSMIKIDQVIELGIKPSEEEMDVHIKFCDNLECGDPILIYNWVNKVRDANCSTGYFDKPTFNRVINDKWFEYCKSRYVIEKNPMYRKYYICSIRFHNIIKDVSISFKKKIADII